MLADSLNHDEVRLLKATSFGPMPSGPVKDLGTDGPWAVPDGGAGQYLPPFLTQTAHR